jgi:hypothetical protein
LPDGHAECIEIIPNEVDFTNINECLFEIKKNYYDTIKDKNKNNVDEYYENMKIDYTSIIDKYVSNICNLIETKLKHEQKSYIDISYEFGNITKSCKNFINKYKNEFIYKREIDVLANNIESNKFITIYCDEECINDLAKTIHNKFEESEYEFYNINTEYRIYPGIYTRLSETRIIENNKECIINRYTPAIFKSTFDYYLKDHKNEEHPFSVDLCYGNDKLPKNITEINKRLPKQLLYDCGCEYLNYKIQK